MSKFKQTMAKFGLAETDPMDMETYEDEYVENEVDAAPSAELDPLEKSAFPLEPAGRSLGKLENISDFSLSNRSSSVTSVTASSSNMADLARIVTIHPRSFEDAPRIGTSLREGVPVIVNLSDMQPTEQRRMVDFCAGVIFAINGLIERVSKQVFLLSPASVEVVEEDGHSDNRHSRKF